MSDELLQVIRDDVKEIKSDIKSMHQTLEKNTASLIVHEHRTTLAEKRIERFEGGVKWLLGLLLTSALGVLAKLFLG